MARSATRPRYYASRKAYYVQYHGKQHLLSMGPICPKCADGEIHGIMPKCTHCARIRHQADLAFAQLIHMAEIDSAEDNCLVFAVANRFSQWEAKHRKPATCHMSEIWIGKFVAKYGHLRCKDLKPIHLEEWLDELDAQVPKVGRRARRPGPLCSSSRDTIAGRVKRCFAWAVKSKILTRHPFPPGALETSPATKKGPSCLLSQELKERCLDHVESTWVPSYDARSKLWFVRRGPKRHVLLREDSPPAAQLASAQAGDAQAVIEYLGAWEPFGLVLRLLAHTGARPGELCALSAGTWDPSINAFVFTGQWDPASDEWTHKTARYGRVRRIFISDPWLLKVLARYREKSPEGEILRNFSGGPWTVQCLQEHWDALRGRLSLSSALTLYSYRHTHITDMILAGHSWGLIAEVHGTSVKMLQRHYEHLDGHLGELAKFWARAHATKDQANG